VEEKVRFAAQPMEGWDAEPDGRPSELTRRRWLRMATSGAKLAGRHESGSIGSDGTAQEDMSE
jgi:NADPH2 dehydrogenase